MGHQPLAVAWPAAFLERAGYRPALMDVSVEPLDAQKLARARLVAISVPMHTALRLGVGVAEHVRRSTRARTSASTASTPPSTPTTCWTTAPTTASAARPRRRWSRWPRRSSRRRRGAAARAWRAPGRPAAPNLARLALPAAEPRGPAATRARYATLERDGRTGSGRLRRGQPRLPAPVHATAPSRRSTAGGSSSCRARSCLDDVRQQVAAGRHAHHLRRPRLPQRARATRCAVARALHAEFPDVTFDFTAKVEHILARPRAPARAGRGSAACS